CRRRAPRTRPSPSCRSRAVVPARRPPRRTAAPARRAARVRWARAPAGQRAPGPAVRRLRAVSPAPRYEIFQPLPEPRTDVGTVAGEPDDGPQVVGSVTGVVSPPAEDHAVHRLARKHECPQRIGQLDLPASPRLRL